MAHFSCDLPADIQDYMSKLAELNIFLTGKSRLYSCLSILNSPEEEIENYKEAFHEFDSDGSGNISTKGESFVPS